MKVHSAVNISMFRRIRVGLQQKFLCEGLDPTFSFKDFLEGAKVAYVVVRQITSNVKEASKLQVLDGMVCPKLLQVNIKKNIQHSSRKAGERGKEVKFRNCQGIDIYHIASQNQRVETKSETRKL